jgi:hypothetical protein
MAKNIVTLGKDKGYKRPKVTYQEKLSAEEIEDKLKGYIKVNDIAEVEINTHIRYFTKDEDGEYTFRLGGFLSIKKDADRYVVLSNGQKKWSVQVANTIFYRKMSHTEEIEKLHEYYKKKLKVKDQEIKKLNKDVEGLTLRLKKTKKIY